MNLQYFILFLCLTSRVVCASDDGTSQDSRFTTISEIQSPTNSSVTSSSSKSSQLSEKFNSIKSLDALLNKHLDFGFKEFEFEKPTGVFHFRNRKEWTKACSSLPKNISIMAGVPQKSAFLQCPTIHNKSGAWNEFELCLTKAFDAYRHGQLADASAWTKKGYPSKNFYEIRINDGKNIVDIFEPYVQKLALHVDDKILFHGDLHGDIHSLLALLTWLENRGYLQEDSFTLTNSNMYLVFLGDYVDHGYYGAEVLYTLLRLKIANPEQVILVRGNHEDKNFHGRHAYSFIDELSFKFRPDKDVIKLTTRLYNFMPVALYVGHGDDYLQCCHGGIEHGYQPAKLLNSSAKFDLLGELLRFDCVSADDYKIGYMMSSEQSDGTFSWFHPDLAENFVPDSLGYDWIKLGFAWFDFAKIGPSLWFPYGVLACDKDLTQAILEYQNKDSQKKVRGIFRGHQHALTTDRHDPTNLMYELLESKGVYKLWKPIEIVQSRFLTDGIVWTFNVTPDSLHGLQNHYTTSAFAILSIREKYKDWPLSVYNILPFTQLQSRVGSSEQSLL